jgi:hypothetical protein
MINANSQINSGNHSSVMITFSNNAGAATNVSYNNAGTTVSNVKNLTPNTNYRLDVVADYRHTGTGNRDSYSFTISDLTTLTVVYKSPPISTRSTADLAPNCIVFYGGAGNTAFNASPFFQIDNLKFIATDTGPFVWGVAGHPGASSSSAYASIVSIHDQLALVDELGCGYYRVESAAISNLLANTTFTQIKFLPILSAKLDAALASLADVETANYNEALAFAQAYSTEPRITHIELGNELDLKCLQPGTAGGNPTDYNFIAAPQIDYARIRAALLGMSRGIKDGGGAYPLKRIINVGGWYHYGFFDRILAENLAEPNPDKRVEFDVIGWHWYSGGGAMSRVMKELSKYNRPIWVTEMDRVGGTTATTTLLSDNFDDGVLDGWTTTGTWTGVTYGTTKVAANLDQNAGATLTRTLSAPLTDNWELSLDYDWRYGGWPDGGNKNLVIQCDILNAAGNGYRLDIRQGDSNDTAYTGAVLQFYKVTGGTVALLAQGTGYDQGGFGNGTPQLKNIRLQRDKNGHYPNTFRIISDRDGPNGNDASVFECFGDESYDNFTKIVIGTRGYSQRETPIIDNFSLTRFGVNEESQALELTRMIPEIRNFPGVEALFVYELIDEPDVMHNASGAKGSFYSESNYGLCALKRDTYNGPRSFSHAKEGFDTFQQLIVKYGTVPATETDGIIVDDAYAIPATQYSDDSLWLPAGPLNGYYGSGYRHDGNTNKTVGGNVRFYTYIPVSGNYEVYVRFPASGTNASAVPVKVSRGSTIEGPFYVNQTVSKGWNYVGTFAFPAWQPGNPYITNGYTYGPGANYVEIGTIGTTGTVIADAVRFKRVP